MFNTKILNTFRRIHCYNYNNHRIIMNATTIRHYCTNKLTHLDENGKPRMVDISRKKITKRTAHAQATVILTPPIIKLITDNKVPKGNVLTISELAGIMGAKKTNEIIPLCHNININQILIRANLFESQNQIVINAIVTCEGKTGVEMEALTAVSISALTIYDMCKKLSKEIVISNVHLVEKTGGESGDYVKKLMLNFDHSKLDSTEIHVFPQIH